MRGPCVRMRSRAGSRDSHSCDPGTAGVMRAHDAVATHIAVRIWQSRARMGMQDCFYGVAVGLRLGWGLKAS